MVLGARSRIGKADEELDVCAAPVLMERSARHNWNQPFGPMPNVLDHDVEPFDTGPLLWWVLGLLGAALVLELFVAVPWTRAFADPGTWVLIGVFVGFALRLGGRALRRHGYRGAGALRWTSVVVWAASALGGLLAWLL